MSTQRPHLEVVRNCLLALSLRGLRPCGRTEAGGGLMPSGRFKRFGTRHWPDITAVVPPTGRALFIEVKTGRARLTAGQRRFRDCATDAGAVHIVARSADDLIEQLIRGGILSP